MKPAAAGDEDAVHISLLGTLYLMMADATRKDAAGRDRDRRPVAQPRSGPPFRPMGCPLARSSARRITVASPAEPYAIPCHPLRQAGARRADSRAVVAWFAGHGGGRRGGTSSVPVAGIFGIVPPTTSPSSTTAGGASRWRSGVGYDSNVLTTASNETSDIFGRGMAGVNSPTVSTRRAG